MVPVANGFAQEPPGEPAEHAHEETIVITATAVGARADELLQGVSVMGSNELSEDASGGLGDVLSAMPGISTTSFGPAASRPIIRGLGGDRVRLLVNGVGILDASTASPDHAVNADALEATRVEVVRGPAAIVYGGNAIGGVVNVIDGRIPEKALDKTVEGQVVAGVSSVDRGNIGAVRLQTGTEHFVLSGELVRRYGGDTRIADFARTPALRAIEGDGPRNRLPNSNLVFKTGAIGGSYVSDAGFIGASVKKSTSNYGLPQEEDARIDMAQKRFDARARFDVPLGFFDQVSADFGLSDYRHFELEGGDIGTRFDNEGWELRTRIRQKDFNGWTGSIGFDGSRKVFSALGAEAFLPRTRTRDLGGFVAQRRNFGSWGLEGGARLETRDLRTGFAARSFTPLSLSGGAFVRPSSTLFLSLFASRTERAPTDIELFSDGPHLAESTFTRGNSALQKERAFSLEGIARFHNPGWDTHISVYRTRFNNFIFLSPTGAIVDNLPEFIYRQENVTFSGAEIIAERDLWAGKNWSLRGDASLAFVRARAKISGNLPRIPPLDITGGLNFEIGRFENRAEIVMTARQNKIAAFETPTKGSSIINLGTTYHPLATNDGVRLVFKLKNLTNTTHRTHASFLKDRVPSPGRSFNARLIVDF